MLGKCRLITHIMFLQLFILVFTFNVTASEHEDDSYQKIVTSVDQLRKTNPPLALQKINILVAKLPTLTAYQQVEVIQLKTKLLSDAQEFTLAKKNSLEGLSIANEHNIRNKDVAILLYTLGFANESLGDLSQATKDYENAFELSKQLNNNELIAYGFINLGAVYYLTAEFEQSLVFLTDALNIAKKEGNDELTGLVTNELAILYGYLRDDEKAIFYYQICYDTLITVGHIEDAINCLSNMGLVYLEQEKYPLAKATFLTAEQLLSKDISAGIAHTIYLNLSYVFSYLEKNYHQEAYRYLLLAEQYIEQVEQHEAKLFFLLDKASVLKKLNKYHQALEALEQAKVVVKSSQSTNLKYIYAQIASTEMKIFAALGEFEQAYKIQQQYTELAFANVREHQLNDIKDIRIAFESEQATLENTILAEQQALQEQLLANLKIQKQKQLFGVLLGIGLLVFFAWWFYLLSKGKNKLLRITQTDELTGIANRRHLNSVGFHTFTQAKLHHVNFSLLMMDVDHFKKINDSLGHSQGDEVLKVVASIGESIMRDSDTIARIGGEEFICLLVGATKQQAVEVAERLKVMVQSYAWPKELSEPLTVSIGVASFDTKLHHDFNDVLKIADNLMYQAKRQGRNQVCF